MKKTIVFFLIFKISFFLISCENSNDDNTSEPNKSVTAQTDLSIKEDINKMKIIVNSHEFFAELYDSETTRAFAKILPMTLNMSSIAHEKYCYLPENLPTETFNPGIINSGDIMLWGSNCLVLFYESFTTSYSYTKIGKIINIAGLSAALDGDSTNIKFSLLV